MTAIHKLTNGSLLGGEAYDVVLARLFDAADFSAQTIQPSDQDSALTLQGMVRDLRNTGYSVTAVAEILQVERKTVYSWLDTMQAPRAENEARITEVWNLLIAKVRVDGRSLYRLWNRPLGAGGTLRELITADQLDGARISAALDELGPAALAYQRADAAVGRRPTGRGNAIHDEMPTALLERD